MTKSKVVLAVTLGAGVVYLLFSLLHVTSRKGQQSQLPETFYGVRDFNSGPQDWRPREGQEKPTPSQQRQLDLGNLFFKRANWTATDVDTLISAMQTSVRKVDIESDFTFDDLDRQNTITAATIAVMERLHCGLPIDEMEKPRLIDELKLLLRSNDRNIRMGAIGAMKATGLVLDSDVRKQLTAMRLDLQPAVAAMARTTLSQLDNPKAVESWKLIRSRWDVNYADKALQNR